MSGTAIGGRGYGTSFANESELSGCGIVVVAGVTEPFEEDPAGSGGKGGGVLDMIAVK